MRPNPENRDLTSSRRLYAAGLVTSITGVAAISAAVESAGLLAAAGILIAIGSFVSVRLRAAGRNLRIVEGIVVAICLATYARLFSTGEASPILSPGLAMFHKELSLAVMLVWAEVVRSYALISDEAVLFTTVPSLALIGVVATTSPGPDTLAYFAVWLVASVTMFVEAGQAVRKKEARFESLWLAGGLGIGATAAGMLLSPVLHTGSLNAAMAIAPGLYANRLPTEALPGTPAGNVLPIAHGPVRLTSREVMRVRSDIGGYWRGRVWTSYTGRDWTSSASAVAVSPAAETAEGTPVFRAPVVPAASPARRQLRQTFTITTAPESSVFAASEPIAIAADAPVLQRDWFNCWRFTNPQPGPVRSYTVVSSVPEPTPREMRSTPREYPPRIRRYLRVPLAAARVDELAQTIAGRERTPYDKVAALQRYLSENYTYDLQAPRLPVTADDAVSYFLFTSKRGYCDIFASSLAIMARCAGVPARLATGYWQGERDPETGEWVVRDRDRHSWVEVYFPGYGWVPFEATPAGQSPESGFWSSVWREARMMFLNPVTRTLLLVAALAMALAALRMVTSSGPAADPFRRARQTEPRRRHAQRCWKRLARQLQGHGVRTGRSTTPMELYRRASEALAPEANRAREALRAALEIVTLALYSRQEDAAGIEEELDIACAAASRELRRVEPRLFKRARNG